MHKLIQVITTLLLAVMLTNAQGQYLTFEQYIDKFNKNYTDEQKIIRKKIYEDRIATFATITDFTPGVNQFTDMT